MVQMGQAMYPWNVDKVHTNTQYLLREYGRGRLYETLNNRGIQMVAGGYKAESSTYEA